MVELLRNPGTSLTVKGVTSVNTEITETIRMVITTTHRLDPGINHTPDSRRILRLSP